MNLEISRRLEEYLNCSNPTELFEKYKGTIDRCFILGTGPSINNIDLGLLENEFTIVANDFCKGLNMTKKTLNPSIVCIANMREISEKMRENFYHDFNSSNSCNNIIMMTDILYHRAYMTRYETSPEMYKKLKESIEKYRFFCVSDIDKFNINKDITENENTINNSNKLKYRALYYHNVPLLCINVANYLGAKNIYFIGCDMPVKTEHFYDKNYNVSGQTMESIMKHKNQKKYWNELLNGYQLRMKQFSHINYHNCNGYHNIPQCINIKFEDIFKEAESKK